MTSTRCSDSLKTSSVTPGASTVSRAWRRARRRQVSPAMTAGMPTPLVCSARAKRNWTGPSSSRGLAELDQVPLLEQHGAVAEAFDRSHVVRDEQDRAPFVTHALELPEALLLK